MDNITRKLLRLLVMNAQGDYTADAVTNDDGSAVEDWWVADVEGDCVYAENTEEEARIQAGLCNLLGTYEWDTLEPYMLLLMPETFPDQLGK